MIKKGLLIHCDPQSRPSLLGMRMMKKVMFIYFCSILVAAVLANRLENSNIRRETEYGMIKQRNGAFVDQIKTRGL